MRMDERGYCYLALGIRDYDDFVWCCMGVHTPKYRNTRIEFRDHSNRSGTRFNSNNYYLCGLDAWNWLVLRWYDAWKHCPK